MQFALTYLIERKTKKMAEEIAASSADYQYDRMRMLKAFDDTKAGVKGLNDSGLLKLPKIFVRPSAELEQEKARVRVRVRVQVEVPVIDLRDIHNEERRKQIVEQVRNASETWGFFQVVNHGIPLSVIEGMIDGVRGFHEQDVDEKKKYYTRDTTRAVRYNSNYDLFSSTTANWKDTLTISFNSGTSFLNPAELPIICRDSAVEYSKHIENLGNILLGMLSEALGVKSEVLEKMKCSEGHRLHCHYYPACPEPELVMGISKHSDAGFLTILVQNTLVSGLQVLYQGQWIDIHPVSGGLVVNIGDLLQLVSNGKFKSIEHRAIVNRVGPRISVACFFSGPLTNTATTYGPIQDLITEANPAVYREVALSEYLMNFFSTSLENYRALDCYKL